MYNCVSKRRKKTRSNNFHLHCIRQDSRQIENMLNNIDDKFESEKQNRPKKQSKFFLVKKAKMEKKPFTRKLCITPATT